MHTFALGCAVQAAAAAAVQEGLDAIASELEAILIELDYDFVAAV